MEWLTTHPGGGRIPEELLINMDMTTVALAKKNIPVLVSRKIAQQLAKRGLSVGRVATKEKNRFVHLLTAISAAGARVCTIAVVYDNNFPDKPNLIEVRG